MRREHRLLKGLCPPKDPGSQSCAITTRRRLRDTVNFPCQCTTVLYCQTTKADASRNETTAVIFKLFFSKRLRCKTTPEGTGRPQLDTPLCWVQWILLGSFVADPDAAELPLHMFAVEHMSKEHLVAGERLPAKKGHVGGHEWQMVCLLTAWIISTSN